jgi:hypothetical protein
MLPTYQRSHRSASILRDLLDTLIFREPDIDPWGSVRGSRVHDGPCLAANIRSTCWDEIALGDVAPVIELSRELITAHLK